MPAYRISFPNLHSRLIDVEMRFHASEQEAVLNLPAWIPGSYMIRDYARHVVSARAESDGLDVALEKIDKSSWRAAPVERELTLVFEIYAHDYLVLRGPLRSTHAFFNGTCVFPAVVGQESRACELEILPP